MTEFLMKAKEVRNDNLRNNHLAFLLTCGKKFGNWTLKYAELLVLEDWK